MKKLFFFLAIIIIVVAGLFFYANRNGAPAVVKKIRPAERVWIEVLSPKVAVRQGSDLRDLKTGDALGAGETIVTGQAGLANIHFPDGSIARLDADTELAIGEGSCDLSDGSLKVKVFLKMGRFWSKIIKLATPESFWEVRTGNAVAAVRGTAFGVEYSQGRTLIIGSQNEVSATAVDPTNGETIVGAAALVGPDQVLEILDADFADFKSGKKSLANLVGPAPTALLKSQWVERFKRQDDLIDGKIQSLRDGGLNETDVQSALRSENEKELYNKAPEVFQPVDSSDGGAVEGTTVEPASGATDEIIDGGGSATTDLPVDDASTSTDLIYEDSPNGAVGADQPTDAVVDDGQTTSTEILTPVLPTGAFNPQIISPLTSQSLTNLSSTTGQ